MGPLGNLFCARAVENFLLHVRVHEGGALLALDAHGVFNRLIGDLLVALADDGIDGRLAARRMADSGVTMIR